MIARVEATEEVVILWEKAEGRRLKNDPSPEQVNAMGMEIERVRNECGGIDVTRAIVLAAQNPDNPLHGQFEWDVEKAAWSAWVKTANTLIHSFRPVETEVVAVHGASRDVGTFVTVMVSDAIEAGYLEEPAEDEEPPGKYLTLDRRDTDITVQELIARQDVQEVFDLLPRIDRHGEGDTVDLSFLSRNIRKAARLVGILE